MAEKTKLTNTPRLLAGMHDAGLDALVAASPENFFYTSGAKILTQTQIRDRLALSVTYGDGTTTLVVNKVEEAQARRYSWIEDVRTYAEFVDSPMKVVASILDEKGLSRSRIGVEKKYVTAAYYEDLQSRLPNASLVSGDATFGWARMVKTEPEIEALRRAASGTDEAIDRALKGAKPGDAEYELARSMSDTLFEVGQGEFRDITWGVATGPNVLTTHYWAGTRKIEAGDPIRINVRSTFRGYYSHLYRIGIVGEPNDEQQRWYERGRDVHMRSIRRMRPGARACDLYAATKDDIKALGIDFRGHLTGHSTGIALHEDPRLQPLDQTVLEPGMVLAAEPMIRDETARDPNLAVFHLEDLVLVTEGDPVILSDRTNTERLIVVG